MFLIGSNTVAGSIASLLAGVDGTIVVVVVVIEVILYRRDYLQL